jgi:hypothetical protein
VQRIDTITSKPNFCVRKMQFGGIADMKKFIALVNVSIVLCLLYGNFTEASAELIVDQSQTSFDALVNLRFSGVTGQEFMPTLSSLDTVELLFDGPDGSFPPNIRGDFSVGIHQGSITGPIVGTSTAVALLTGIFREVVRFDFPTSASLVPGQTYVIEINRLSDPELPFFFGATQTDMYGGGRAIINEISLPDSDLFFREGTRNPVVSEPDTFALTGLCLLGLICAPRVRSLLGLARKRTRRRVQLRDHVRVTH